MKECPACSCCFPDNFNNCPTDGTVLNPSIAGDTILEGRYQLLQRLGHGGMGIVFKARHVFLKTQYAIKVILPDLVGNDPMLVTRFRQEAMLAARIGHRNIVNVTDFGVVGGRMPYLVMDLIKGRSLHDLLVEKNRLTAEMSLDIMAAVCAGVGAAHRQGIVHRDLKPLNIMLQDDVPISEAVKVLDFGLAKIKSGELLGSFVAAQTTGLMGSPYYMAPELWSDEEPDATVDIYSLGVILFQMLAGEVPFKAPTLPAVMKKHMTEAPPRFAAMGVMVSPFIEAVVHHALAKKREDRLPSVEAFINALRIAVTTSSAVAPTPVHSMQDSNAQTISYPYQGTGGAGAVIDAAYDSRTITDSQRRIEDEADRLTREFEEAQRRADEARKRAEEASRKRAEEEAARRRAEEEAARKLAEEEAARQRAVEMARKRAEEEAARRRDEEEAARKVVEEEALKRAEEEAARQRVAEEAVRLAKEVVEAQRRAEDARLRADEEARKRSEEQVARKRAEEEAHRLALEVAEAQHRAEEARLRAEEEALKRAQDEEERKRVEEEEERLRAEEEARMRVEEETARKRAAEDADRLAHEIAEAQHRAEEARLRAEEEAQKRAEAEVARQKAEEEARKLSFQVAEAQRRAEESRKRAEEASRISEETRLHQTKVVPHANETAELTSGDTGGTAIGWADSMRADQKDREQAGITNPAMAGIQTTQLTEDIVGSEGQGSLSQGQSFRGAAQQASLHSRPAGEAVLQDQSAASVPGFEVEKRRSPLPIIVGAVAFLLVIAFVGAVALYVWRNFGSTAPVQQPRGGPAKPEPKATPSAPVPPKPDLVAIPGGTFQMGRSDIDLNTQNPYDLTQWPAHAVTVKAFAMDRTEVSNAEYADFVGATNYVPPRYWRNGKPPSNQEQWPVTNVSLDDVKAFILWRSKRDGVKYRLPTEEEWEYAARNGSQATLYPWGNEWLDDHANVDTSSLKPVGSYPQGASQAGVQDLIGNVWEWTSTDATLYPGNTKVEMPQGKIIRGGAYLEAARGPDAITATRRSVVKPSDKQNSIGFRLVRDGS